LAAALDAVLSNKKERALACWSTLAAVLLSGDVPVQMVQNTVCLLAALPFTLVYALNLVVLASWTRFGILYWGWAKSVDGRRGTLVS